LPSNFLTLAASEKHAIGHDDRAFAGAFERRDKVEKKGIVAVLLGRHAIDKATEFIVLWSKPLLRFV
jgi:hypothetical protein